MQKFDKLKAAKFALLSIVCFLVFLILFLAAFYFRIFQSASAIPVELKVAVIVFYLGLIVSWVGIFLDKNKTFSRIWAAIYTVFVIFFFRSIQYITICTFNSCE
jgi:hypothetical protein